MLTPSITESRLELKYKVDPRNAAALIEGVSAELTEHRFVGKGANRLPRARHYVTTVYFDTEAGDLFRAARDSDENLKLRAREYYDVHPELTELATSASDLVRYDPLLWIEIKRKEGSRTKKRRIGVRKTHVTEFLEHRRPSIAPGALAAAYASEGDHDVIDELTELRARLRATLSATCIVNYRRIAWQNDNASLRITLDQRLACFRCPDDLWIRETALVRERLGKPVYEEPEQILEVKAKGAWPPWLSGLLERCACVPSTYSKFVTASSAVRRFEQNA